MLANHLRSSFRTLLKNKAYAFINMISLTLGIVCFTIVYLTFIHESCYDCKISKAEQLYRVQTIISNGEYKSVGAPLGLFNVLDQDFPEIEKVIPVILERGIKLKVENHQQMFHENLAFVDNYFFELMQIDWLSGNPEYAFNDINNIVITESIAKKFFGEIGNDYSRCVGETIKCNEELILKIAGVTKDPPSNSNFPFNLLAPLPLLKKIKNNPDIYDEWFRFDDDTQILITLTDQAIPKNLESKFPEMLEKYIGPGFSEQRAHELVPLDQIYEEGGFLDRKFNANYIYGLGIIGLFIILVSCFNYINLSTSLARTRFKEAAIRKILGSNFRQLIIAFLSESYMLTLISAFLAFLIIYFFMPEINAFTGIPIAFDSLLREDLLIFVGITILTVGFISGIIPAVKISTVNVLSTLKGSHSGKGDKSIVRNFMVFAQFLVSQILIFSTIIVISQMNYINNKDLGLDRDDIITVDYPESKLIKREVLSNEAMNIKGIESISFSYDSPSSGAPWTIKTKNENETITAQLQVVDENFLQTYGLTLLSGEWFVPSDSLNTVVVNEAYIKELESADVNDAINKQVAISEENYFIKGVIKNFHSENLKKDIEPVVFLMIPSSFRQVNIKLEPDAYSDQQATIESIDNAFTNILGEEFDYRYFSDELSSLYTMDVKTFDQIRLFAIISIFINSLGLLAMIAFSFSRREKEILIRKTLGATKNDLTKLLFANSAILLLIAFVISIPISYAFMTSWLQYFTYRIEITATIFLIGGGIFFLLNLALSIFQIHKYLGAISLTEKIRNM